MLRSLALLWSFVVALSCVSPLDCNAKECMDCVCKDGECYCADGWSGSDCTTPFCVKRSDCSNHGDCIATLTNISCVCDAGWGGARCEAPVCPLNCTHGGVPDANCTQCVGCLGAWYGKQCDQWNASVSVDALLTMLSGIAADSQAALDALAPIRPLCSQSQECLGWGVDLTYGGLSTLPVLQLSYTDPSKTWSGFREPVEATVTFAENPQFDFQLGSGVYPLISDFTNMVGAKLGAGIGLAGIYGDQWEGVFDEHYQQPADLAMTVVQAQMWLYQMDLQSSTPALDKFAARAIASLPPDYNSDVNQAVYQHFIKNWGTSVVTQSYSGGVIEQTSDWKSFLLDKPYAFDENFLLNNAQIDFSSTLGIGGHSGTIDPTYAANRRNATTCLGGNPASCLDVPSWQASLIQNPILVRYQSTPLAAYIADATTKANVQQALHAYIAQENAAWESLDKCPVTCNNHGTCSHPATTCSCAFYSGRMCSNPTLSGEYLLQGKGNNAASMMAMNDGFCFITNGHGWFKDGEHCQITNDGQTWILNKTSGQSYFECGSRCVYSPSWTKDQITTEYFLSGSGTTITNMIPISKGFCFMVEGRAFYEGGEQCWISANSTTGTWTLFKTSQQDSFNCGARCVYSDPVTSKTKEFMLHGQGDYSQTLVSVNEGICWVSRGSCWYEDKEHCQVTIDQGQWTLRSSSGQSAFICGATCTTK